MEVDPECGHEFIFHVRPFADAVIQNSNERSRRKSSWTSGDAADAYK